MKNIAVELENSMLKFGKSWKSQKEDYRIHFFAREKEDF